MQTTNSTSRHTSDQPCQQVLRKLLWQVELHLVKLEHFSVCNTKVVHRVCIMPVVEEGLLIICHTTMDISLELDLKENTPTYRTRSTVSISH